MRATLDAHGAGRTVVVADSFQGFPVADEQGRLSDVDFLAVPQEEVRGELRPLRPRTTASASCPGYFEETLPGLTGERWSLIRMDGDTYEATWVTLASLYGGLAPGGYVIVDDYRALTGMRPAVDDFRERHGIEEPLEDVDWTCVRWRRTSDAPFEAAPPPASAPTRTQAPGARRHRPAAQRARDRARRRGRGAARAAGARRPGGGRAAPPAAGAPGTAAPPLMIAFGCAITRPEVYARCAEPGIRRAAEPDSVVLARRSAGTLFENYNALLDEAAALPGLEALVLVHQDTEIVDAGLLRAARERARRRDGRRRRLRRRGRRPQHRLVGGLGVARVVRAPLRRARRRRSALVLVDLGRGAAVRARRRGRHARRLPARAAAVDRSSGSASTSRSARCTGTTSTSACRCARPAARPSPPTSRRSTTTRSSWSARPEEWVQAHIRIAEKWDGRMPGIGTARRRRGRSARAAPRPSATPPGSRRAPAR